MPPIDVVLANVRNRTYDYPYLGIAYLAALLERRGVRVQILDGSPLALPPAALAARVAELRPRLFGLTFMSPDVRDAYQVVCGVRARLPDTEVVVGGPHVGADPTIVDDMGLRHGFAGESEGAFVAFCDAILGGGAPPSDLPGLVSGKRVNPAKNVTALDELPFPARHLWPQQLWRRMRGDRWATVLASRGCPYDCSFCHHERQMRYRSPENVVAEVEQLRRDFGCRRIEFVDEIFTVNKGWVQKICALLREKTPDVVWSCETRVNLVDRAFLEELQASGCRGISFGIESGSNRVLKVLSKRQSEEQCQRAFELCRAVGIEPGAFLMIGLPSETERDIEATLKFARENVPRARFSRTILLPGTPLFETAVAEGQTTRDVWRRYMLGETKMPYYVPRGTTELRMRWIYHRTLGSYLFDPRRLLRRTDVRTIDGALGTLRSFARTIGRVARVE